MSKWTKKTTSNHCISNLWIFALLSEGFNLYMFLSGCGKVRSCSWLAKLRAVFMLPHTWTTMGKQTKG